MARRLVVEAEAVAGVADRHDTACVVDPCGTAVGPGFDSWRAFERPIGGVEGIDREHVLDVHEQQLLVLLLMVEAELDEPGHLRRLIGAPGDQKLVHGVVDRAPVVADVRDPGP